MRIVLLVASVAGLAVGGPASAEVLASTEGDDPSTRLELTQMKRSGDTLTLRFTMYNEGDQPIGFSGRQYGDSEQGRDYGSVGGVHLLDGANRKKYLVMRDEDGNCVCSRDVADIEPGKSLNLWAKFPAPPAEVTAVTVVVPHFIPMDDVPIGTE